MPITKPNMPRVTNEHLAAARLHALEAERAFNRVLREIAEMNLQIAVDLSRQDLEDDNLTNTGDAPAVQVK